MKRQTQTLGSGTNVIHKTDKGNQSQSQYKPRIFETVRQKKDQSTKIENYPASAQSNPGMRTTLIGLIDYIAFIGYTEIKKFCQK